MPSIEKSEPGYIFFIDMNNWVIPDSTILVLWKLAVTQNISEFNTGNFNFYRDVHISLEPTSIMRN